MESSDRNGDDPRIYLAAERTFLAWVRTGIAFMAFGFVVARLGVFLRHMAIPEGSPAPNGVGLSLYAGLGLIGFGVVVCLISAVRHGRYVRAIDERRFRATYGTTFAFAVVALLVLAAIGLSVLLIRL